MTYRLFAQTFVALGTYLFLLVPAVYAQTETSQILSVTPPLFQLSILPGDLWQSTVKVVNANPYPLTIYAEVVNFEATGEKGQGKFVPLSEDVTDQTLARWINIAPGPHVISPEQATEISFFVEVPKDAPPGGHYAAILITTQPPASTGEKLAVKTSQAVTALVFLRVEGDVIENGTIREFSLEDSFLPRPEARFKLKFQNKGNVHLQPRGNIVITNMWGAERGIIPINNQSHFGNVLPNSVRDFRFSWQSDLTITEIGRYKAVVTLSYGEAGIQNTSAVAYFWVVPVKITLITLFILALCIFVITLMIKAYVRRMLALAGVDPSEKKYKKLPEKEEHRLPKKVSKTYATVSAPLRVGVLDLRQRLSTVDETIGVLKTVWSFILGYRTFFISVFLLVCIFVGVVIYISSVTDTNQDYRVMIDDGDKTTVIEGSDIQGSETQ